MHQAPMTTVGGGGEAGGVWRLSDAPCAHNDRLCVWGRGSVMHHTPTMTTRGGPTMITCLRHAHSAVCGSRHSVAAHTH